VKRLLTAVVYPQADQAIEQRVGQRPRAHVADRLTRPTCPASGKRACLSVALFGKGGRCPHQQSRGANPALRRAVAKALPGFRQ
jgi:hypothetical protein